MSTIVITRSGKVESEQLSTQFEFRGISYAAPPMGPLRWRPLAPTAQ